MGKSFTLVTPSHLLYVAVGIFLHHPSDKINKKTYRLAFGG